MSTLSISLPEPMKNFVDAEVASGRYNTTDEYLLALIREAQERRAGERQFNLSEMIAAMPPDYQAQEENFGEPVGKEAW